MARTHARIHTSRDTDEGWWALSVGAKALYDLLLIQPDLNYCGVCAIRIRRWLKRFQQNTKDEVIAWLRELDEAGFVILDAPEEEVMIRTFIRHDGVLKQPALAAAALAALPTIESAKIRAHIEGTYGDALREKAVKAYRGGARNGSGGRASRPVERPSDTQSPAQLTGSQPPDGVGEGVGEPSFRGSPERSRARATPKPKRRAATKPIPQPFEVTDALRAWAAEKVPGVDIEHETLRLVEWALGKDERKVRWDAAWRNWMLTRSREGGNPRRNGSHAPPARTIATPAPTDDELARLAAAADRRTSP